MAKDAEWINEMDVTDWRRRDNITVGKDLDGDIGILDKGQGRSIIIHQDHAAGLVRWLVENYPEATSSLKQR